MKTSFYMPNCDQCLFFFSYEFLGIEKEYNKTFSINDLMYTTESMKNFYLGHPVYIYILNIYLG